MNSGVGRGSHPWRRVYGLVVLLGLPAVAAGPGLKVTAAYHVPFTSPTALQAEANAQINAAKQSSHDLGGAVHMALLNQGRAPVALRDVVWSGGTLEAHRADLTLVWQRLQPDPVPAGAEGVVTLCLRERLQADTEFALDSSDGRRTTVTVPAASPEWRIEAVRFDEGLGRACVYVAAPDSAKAGEARVIWNGRPFDRHVRWLNRRPLAGVLTAVVEFDPPLSRGAVQTIRLQSGDMAVAHALRAFDRLSAFGSCGGNDFERYALNGLTASHSFGPSSRPLLDQAGALGVRCAVTTGPAPRDDVIGHPALYAYILTDEPDCQDYGVEDRPMAKRIGAHAPEMLAFARECFSKDPRTATMLTVDLTFTPANYFFYGGLADLTNPDCYTVTCGWPVQVLPGYLDTVRQACAPRPFTFTYQGCWEEIARKLDRDYVGGRELREKGWQNFRDPEKRRGFGRPPHPSEVTMSMIYGVGCGAVALFSYIDASELCGALMFHGSEDLPELWDVLGRTSRTLERIAPLLALSQPVDLATCEDKGVWVRTLWAADRGLVVVAVNEHAESAATPFRLTPAAGVRFHCPRPSWLSADSVVRVADGAWEDLAAERERGGLSWQDTVADAAVYLVANAQTRASLAQRDDGNAAASARGIVAGRRAALQREAADQSLLRSLCQGPPETRLVATPVTAYGIEDGALWNPAQERYNAVEFWERQGITPLGAEWSVTLPETLARTPMRFYWQGRLYGGAVTLSLTGPEDRRLLTETIHNGETTAIRYMDLEFPAAGTYAINLRVTPASPQEHGGRVARMAFLKAVPTP